MAPYQYLDHTADVGIVATGATLAEAFASAAEGLAAVLCDPETVEEREERPLAVSAADLETLLVEWLDEVNYDFEVHRFAYRRFVVHDVTEGHLRATGYGEPLDLSRHQLGEQVKAATYHLLEVRPDGDGYRLQVILDV
ncbi:MAG: archease [Chloroflexi bacterium]|nr:archease [Chloroflexota bacterium]